MRLDIEKIKNACTPTSFRRGKEYCEEGRVSSVERFGERITAIVKGKEPYKVTIRPWGNDFSASCTCPYRQGGSCKHIVAVLLCLLEEYLKVEKGMGTAKGDAAPDSGVGSQGIISNRDIGNLLNIYNLNQDSAKKRFKQYKSVLRGMYRRAFKGSGYHRYGIEVGFTDFEELAQHCIRRGDFDEALLVYRALSEVIAEKMDWVDDSDGYYGGAFADAMDDFANTILAAEFDHDRKKAHIEYLFQKFIANDPDYFEEHYDATLKKICTSEDDLRLWKELLEPHMPQSLPDKEDFIKRFRAWRLFSMMLHILEGLGEWDAYCALMERNYRNDNQLCLWYAERLVKIGQHERAIEVAEEGLRIFPDHLREGLRRLLGGFYKPSDPGKYKLNLKALFLEKRSWKDYYELKALCARDEWSRTIEGIIAELARERHDRDDILIEIYLKEDMFEKALNMVLSKKSLQYLEKYHARLAAKFPDEYFKAYMEFIAPFAKSNTGRGHYTEVVRYLKLMKRIEGYEERVRELVEDFKTTYARRPAFIEELRKVK
ncbi:hypothetical protein GX441_06085 [bacterium]|nr:hypothetical protein [bacterium]